MIASRAKLAVMTVGRKRPGFDQDWNRIMRAAAATAMKTLELHVHELADPVIDDPTTIKAIQQAIAADCDTLLILQPSLGNGQLAMTVAQHWQGPIILWATPERPDGPIVSSCSLVAQHLWSSLLRQLNRPFEFVYGDPNNSAVREELARARNVCHAKSQLGRAKIGVVGSHAPGYMPMDADPFLLQKQFGLQLQRLSLVQFMERVKQIDESAVRDDVDRLQSLNLSMNGVSRDDLPLQSRYYLAMQQVMQEETLDAMAIQCWPEFAAELGQWPYFAITRLSDEGRIVALEGDVEGALTALAGQLAGAGLGYLTDWLEHDDRTIHFWHAGMAPISWCEKSAKNSPSLGRHFNITKPLVLDGALKANQPMTAARIWHCDGEYRAMAFEGRTIANVRQMTGNTALFEVSSDGSRANSGVRERFDALLHAGLPHHVALFQGHHAETLRRVARMTNVQWIE